MNIEKATALAREIFSDDKCRQSGVRWWLFEHGTILLTTWQTCTGAQALNEMKWLADALGPYEGQGSMYGDVNPMPLKRHARTWLVSYPFTTAFVTLVDADDFHRNENRPPADEVVQTSVGAVLARDVVGDLHAGLVARAKRNRDARERNVVASSEE